ncbi:MAG TPA: hypothetical protein VNJ02_17775 [Vicinamibacterales bacterium]|nr:hypothetical protein [Vicinamibacterales bacterium]
MTAGADLQSTLGAVLGAVSGGAPSTPVVITSAAIASRLLALRDLAGLGVKVVIAPEAAGRLIVIDADGLAWVDGGGSVTLSEHGSAQLDDAPTHPATSATVVIDFFSRNLVGIKAVRFTSWMRRADAVAFATIA